MTDAPPAPRPTPMPQDEMARLLVEVALRAGTDRAFIRRCAGPMSAYAMLRENDYLIATGAVGIALHMDDVAAGRWTRA